MNHEPRRERPRPDPPDQRDAETRAHIRRGSTAGRRRTPPPASMVGSATLTLDTAMSDIPNGSSRTARILSRWNSRSMPATWMMFRSWCCTRSFVRHRAPVVTSESVSAQLGDFATFPFGGASGSALSARHSQQVVRYRLGAPVDQRFCRLRRTRRDRETTSTIRSWWPPLTTISSPGPTSLDGLTRSPFTRTCPPLQASVAWDRDLNSLTDQSHTSTRTPSLMWPC